MNAYIKATGSGLPEETLRSIATPIVRIEEEGGDASLGELAGFRIVSAEEDDEDGSMEVLVTAAAFKKLVLLIRRSGKFPDLENALNAY